MNKYIFPCKECLCFPICYIDYEIECEQLYNYLELYESKLDTNELLRVYQYFGYELYLANPCWIFKF
jgi:hypothetical protein